MNKKIMCKIIIPALIIGAGIIYFGQTLLNQSITLSDKSVLIYTGYTREIRLLEYEGTKEWKSEDGNIAEVSDGVISGLSPGKTVIHCITQDGKEYTCDVEVRKSVSEEYRQIAEEEALWLESLQLSNGSFSCYELEKGSTARVNPYFSCYCAIALLRTDYNNEKKDKIEAFINWYYAHMNMEEDVKGSIGTVYDYKAEVSGNTVTGETSKQSYDSADSYSALFLMLLNEYVEKYEDTQVISQCKEKTDCLVDVLLSLESGGYTESKKDSNVKYLMDNAEVYEGMEQALALYKKMWCEDNRIELLEKTIKEFRDEFDSTWWGGDYYYPVLKGNNSSFYGDVMKWDRLYEFATPQLFPVMFGIKNPDEKRSKQVYEQFCSKWNWEEMEFGDAVSGKETWSLIVYGAAAMQDYNRVNVYLNNYRQKSDDRSYPFYSGDSVWVILTCDKAYGYCKDLESRGLEIDFMPENIEQ